MENMSTVVENADIVTNYFADSAQENESLLDIYEKSIKDELKTVINQHSISGIVAGVLPTMGIATTLNLFVLYNRLCKKIDLPIMNNFDKLLVPVMNSIKFAFYKNAILLGIIKIVVTGLEGTGIGLPVGILVGGFMGYNFSNKAGAAFANKIKDFVDDNGTLKTIEVQPDTISVEQLEISQTNTEHPLEGNWTCDCGQVNSGNFCQNCGAKKK